VNSILLSIAAILVLVLSALFAAPYVVNWNDYRNVFEAQLTNLLGRQINVGGDVNLRLLPSPYVRFEKISLAGREQSLDLPLLTADSITLWLTVPPLLRGEIEASEMEVTKPHVNLHILANGQGNWSTLKTDGGKENFVPEQVALQTVRIRGGTVELSRHTDSRPLVFDAIEGTLSAKSLQGPYKFSGLFSYAGQSREIQFSTSRHIDGGAMRLKSVLKDPPSGATYTLDGQLTNITKQPQLTAAFVFRLPKKGADSGATKLLLNDVADPQVLPEGTILEARSTLAANIGRAVFSDVRILFANKDQPQSIDGEATLDWKDGLNLNTRLSSKWIDLDRLLTNDKAGKVSVRHAVGLFIDKFMPYQSRFNRAAINIKVTQAALEGDLVKALDLHLDKDGDKFSLPKLTAELPGHTKLELSGRISFDGQPGFTGPVNVKGRDLYRFVRWANGSARKAATPRNDHYALQAMVAFAPGLIEIENAKGEIGESAFSGRFRYRYTGRRDFVLELDGNSFDLGMISDDPLSLNALASSIWHGNETAAAADGKGSQTFAQLLQGANGHLKVRLGHLTLPGLKVTDVDARARLSDGDLEIESLSLDTEDGVLIRGGGKIETTGTQARGKLQAVVDSAGPAGLQNLGQLLGLPKTIFDNEDLLQSISPLRVAVSLQTGLSAKKATNILIDGTAAGSRVSVKARQIGDPSNIGNEPLEISASLTNPSGETLVKQIFPRARFRRFADTGDGNLALHAIGVPSIGMNTLLELEAAGLRGGFEGTVRFAGGENEFDGVLGFTAERAEAGLAVFGVDAYPQAQHQQLSLRAILKKQGEKYHLDEVTARIGSTVAVGSAVIDTGRTPTRSAITVTANKTYLPNIMSLMLKDEIPSIVAAAKNATEGGDAGYWPERIFNHDILGRFEGHLKLKAKSLNVSDSLSLGDGAVAIDLSGGVLRISELSGRLFDGSITATGQFVPGRSGVSFEGTANIVDASLDKLAKTGNARPLARGKVSLDLSLKGHGLSPRGLISELSGNGSVRFGDGKIFSLSPAALPNIARQTPGADGSGLTDQLKAALAGGAFPYRAFAVPVKVAHGTLRVTDIPLRSEKTRLRISGAVDIARLRLDSTLQLNADISEAQKSPPPVNLVFAGPIADIGRITPVIDAESLKRYLIVRRMERDVEHLEKLEREGRQRAPGGSDNRPGSPSAGTIQGSVSGPPPKAPSALPSATNSLSPSKGDVPPPVLSAPFPSYPDLSVDVPAKPEKPDNSSDSNTAWKAIPSWITDVSSPEGKSSSGPAEGAPAAESGQSPASR